LVTTIDLGTIGRLVNLPYQAFKIFFQSLTRTFQFGQTYAEAGGRHISLIETVKQPFCHYQGLLSLGMG
jgi:hypothetical protein